MIGSGVTSIAGSAFKSCDGLKSVYIPSNVTSIGASAFSCESLKEVWTDTPQPLSIASSVFNSTTYNDGVLYVLSKSIGAYKEADPWKNFKSIEGGWFLVTAKANTGGKAEFAGKAVTNDESYSAYVKRGNDTIVTVTPNEGYELKSMTVNDEEKFSDVKDGVLTISNILTDIDVVATFKKLNFKITTTAGEGGTVVPSSEIIEWGDDATVTVTPNEGYELSTLTVNGNDKIGELKDGVLTINAVKADVNVEATFIQIIESISISLAKQVTYMSANGLDFTGYPDLKAYVATGYDKASGTIWLTRVKEVPANTGFLLMGEAETYEIPAKVGGLSSYYQNLFKGTIEGTTIQTTEGANTNYYLSNGDAGVGFYKVQGSVELKPNRAYLSVPTEIPAVGATGSTETIKVSAAGRYLIITVRVSTSVVWTHKA